MALPFIFPENTPGEALKSGTDFNVGGSAPKTRSNHAASCIRIAASDVFRLRRANPP